MAASATIHLDPTSGAIGDNINIVLDSYDAGGDDIEAWRIRDGNGNSTGLGAEPSLGVIGSVSYDADGTYTVTFEVDVVLVDTFVLASAEATIGAGGGGGGGGGGGLPGVGCRWFFTDPVTAETFVFPINPKEASVTPRERNFTHASTTSSNGRALIFEGAAAPAQISFEAKIYSQEQLTAFQAWAAKKYILQLTDDLGQANYILIDEFTPERVARVGHTGSVWKHTYKMTCTIVTITA